MALPLLRKVKLPQNPVPPVKRIQTDEDVEFWRTTQGYIDYGLFIRRLNQAVIGHELPYAPPPDSVSEAIRKTVDLLDEVERWIDDIPPQTSTQRFGNLAFRDWGKRLEERSPSLLEELLPPDLHPAMPLVQPYLLQSFGSFGRIDYGSGHELAFGLFMCSLTLLRFYQPTEEEERALALIVFEKYLEVVWKLQDVYKLEPAGSHGVWGLDDYCFLPYIWGSGQVQEHIISRPPDILSPPLPPTTLYNQAVNRILKLKTGAFHEHSSQLFNIASSVPTWWKVNQGMMKMYEAEVLGKRVVVQHLPLGGVIQWGEDDEDEIPENKPPKEQVPGFKPNLLATPATWAGGETHSSPGSVNSPLPLTPPPTGASPMLSTPTLPAAKNLAGSPTSPVRQNSMPRPKGGRLAAALASSPQPPSLATPLEGNEETKTDVATPALVPTSGMQGAVHQPRSTGESSPESLVEPDLKKESEVLQPPTSPQRIAKILTTNPVDTRTYPSSEGLAAATPVPGVVSNAKPSPTVEPTTDLQTSPPEPTAAAAAPDSQSSDEGGANGASTTTSHRRKRSSIERLATLLGCGPRK